jgi:hypothetical protein
LAYTPELSDEASGILRRVAWAVRLPMTKTLEAIILKLPEVADKSKVCARCKDHSKCELCAFSIDRMETC